MKRLLAILALSAPSLWAGTYTAATCNRSDVNAVINGPTHTAVDGDVIQIPSGSCTWSSGVIVSGVCISILGNGTPNTGSGSTGSGTINTTITDTINDGSTSLISVQGLPYTSCNSLTPGSNQYLRISTLTIQPGGSVSNGFTPVSVVGVCTSSGCPEARLDNLKFTGWAESVNGTQSAWMMRTDNVWGTTDHNTITGTNNGLALGMSHQSAWQGTGDLGDNSWHSGLTFGTSQAMYFEYNSLAGVGTMEDCDEPPQAGSAGGCRDVVRDNTYTAAFGSVAYFHGTDTTGRPRGGLQMEAYNNTFQCGDTSQGCDDSLMDFRSGTGFLYGNTTSNAAGAWQNTFVKLDIQRRWRAISTPWGECNGFTVYDNNNSTAGLPTGNYTGSSGQTTMTDSALSWTTNQWVGNPPYEIGDVTQGGSNSNAYPMEIASNTGTTATPLTSGTWTWNSGDSWIMGQPSVCVDQPSRSLSTLYSGGTPSPASANNETLTPIYEWNDAGSNLHGNFGTNTNALIANRDWYTDNQSGAQTTSSSPFNGTSGMGWGTLARRPATCTSGVAYAEYSGSTFVQLDKCVSSAWVNAAYVPYTDPHPLDGGSTPTPPNAPSTPSLTAIVF